MMRKLKPETKRTIRDAILCLSLANLLFLKAWSEILFFPSYYIKQPSLACAAIMLNVLLLAAILWGAVLWSRRSQSRATHLAAKLGFGVIVLLVLNVLRQNLNRDSLAMGHLVRNLVFWSAVLGMAWQHRKALRTAHTLALIFAPLVAINLGRVLAHCDFSAESPPKSLANLHRLAIPASERTPRLVWLVFDEMDQRIAFGERPTGLYLPEFDRFRGESVYFENAYPSGSRTEVSIPALLTGCMVTNASPDGRDCLRLNLMNKAGPVDCRSLPNLFTKAQGLGLTTAVVGWFQPYSRIFPDADVSLWEPTEWYGRLGDSTLHKCMTSQFRAVFWYSGWQQARDSHGRRVKSYENITSGSQRLAADERVGLLFSHIPIPHLPGLFDRRSGQFGAFTAYPTNTAEQYLGNLVLTDCVLGEFRTRMSTAGLWDKSTIIITADHWLRDIKTNGGKTDHRIPLLIKMAGQIQGTVYSTPVNNLLLHEFALAVMRGEVTSSVEVVHWMDTNRTRIPVDAYVWSLPRTGTESPKLISTSLGLNK